MPPSNPQNNQQPFFGVKVSKPGVPVQNATPKQLVYSNNYDTTTYYDSDDARIILGQLPDGTYGIKVSLPGADVTTASPQQLAFSSSFASLTSIWSMSDTQTVGAGESVALGPYSTGAGVLTLPLITTVTDNFQYYSTAGTNPGSAYFGASVEFLGPDSFTIGFPFDNVDTHTYVFTINMMLLTNQ